MQNIFSPNSSSDRVFLTLLPGGLGDLEQIVGVRGAHGPTWHGWVDDDTNKDIQEDDNPYFLGSKHKDDHESGC